MVSNRSHCHIPAVYGAGPKAEKPMDRWKNKIAVPAIHHNSVVTFGVLPSGRFLLEPHTPRIVKERPKTVYRVGAFGRQPYSTTGAPPLHELRGFRAWGASKREIL
jgi:hypothetical protein